MFLFILHIMMKSGGMVPEIVVFGCFLRPETDNILPVYLVIIFLGTFVECASVHSALINLILFFFIGWFYVFKIRFVSNLHVENC